MLEQDPPAPEKRIFVGVRLRPSSLERVKAAAEALGTTQSDVLRQAFALGLPQVEAQIRTVRPAPKR